LVGYKKKIRTHEIIKTGWNAVKAAPCAASPPGNQKKRTRVSARMHLIKVARNASISQRDGFILLLATYSIHRTIRILTNLTINCKRVNRIVLNCDRHDLVGKIDHGFDIILDVKANYIGLDFRVCTAHSALEKYHILFYEKIDSILIIGRE
jgi:hypothetical protein